MQCDFPFIDRFKDVAVGQKVRVRTRYSKRQRHKSFAPIHPDFFDFIKMHGNEFTVDTIQECDDDLAMIAVEEIPGRALEYEQIEPVGRRSKVFNWHRSRP